MADNDSIVNDFAGINEAIKALERDRTSAETIECAECNGDGWVLTYNQNCTVCPRCFNPKDQPQPSVTPP